MGRNKQPIAVLEAKGKSHLTKKEIEERRGQELKVSFVDIKAPEYLNEDQQKEFMSIAEKLLALGIMTELDVDCLAMYVLSHDLYIAYTVPMTKYANEGDVEAAKKIQTMQEKAFKQAHTAAKSLGLTITDRCKIVVPSEVEEDDEL